MDDMDHMRTALALARRSLGRVWPNPSVGCVIVRGGVVVGRGWTQPGGRPHGETEALARAGAAARGATAYVSLEPCAHWGKTPPCADALIAAGVARVVVPIEDPDPRVCGRGIAALRAAGIAVETGLLAAAAAEVNAGFLSRLKQGRPLVTLKLAATLDGRIATAAGESRWITGEAARERGHLLRAAHDAIMVGSGTAMADDPDLTCRLPGLAAASPVRIVVDSALRLPPTARVVATAQRTPTWIVCAAGAGEESRAALAAAGVDIIEAAAAPDGTVDLADALRRLAERGLTRLLAEGGAALAAALLRADLVDRIAWFHAPAILGSDARAAVGRLDLAHLMAAPRFRRAALEELGDDVLETLTRPA
jgi:diaminohydroxyphosphoribosylaminopyrimidine deaminase / 5-amino-6-(5-phosphoribosylamino)uracil reductase